MRRSILFFAILFSFGAMAAPFFPQSVEIRATWYHVCVLERIVPGSGPLECWFAQTGQEHRSYLKKENVSHLALAPMSLDAGNKHWAVESVCFVVGGRLSCEGKIGAQLAQPLAGLTKIKALAGGRAGICAIDADRGIQCSDGQTVRANYPINQRSSISEGIPAMIAPKLIAVGSTYACAIDEGGTGRCWGGRRGKSASDVDPKTLRRLMVAPFKFKHPTSLSVGGENACALDEGVAKCWGDERYVPSLTGDVSLIALEEYWGCATSVNGTKCFGTFEVDRMNAVITKAKQPLALAVSTRTACALEESGEILCYKYDDSIRIERRSLDLVRLSNGLRAASAYVYSSRAWLLEKTAAQLDTLPPVTEETESVVLPRLFVMNALLPFLEGIESTWCQEKLLPPFKETLARYNKKYGVASLRDFASKGDFSPFALTLAESSLRVVEPYLTDAADRGALVSVRAEIGKASASKQPRDAGLAILKHAAVLEKTMASPRARGAAVMILAVGKFLEGVGK